MVEYVTGMEVKELLSDLNTLYDDNPLDIDGSILIRMSNKVKADYFVQAKLLQVTKTT